MSELSSPLVLGRWKRGALSSLEHSGIERSEAKLEINLIVEHLLGMNQASQLANRDRVILSREKEALDQMIHRRTLREPLAHLFGEWEFWGLPIKVSPATLIPRADTEVLVEEALRWLGKLPSDHVEGALVLDIGAGSGCISMALASERPECQYRLLDLSQEALEVSRAGWKNLVNKGVIKTQTSVDFIESNGLNSLRLSELTREEEALLVVSNPPYIKRCAESSLMPEVARFDPHIALFDEREDGLGIAEHFIDEAYEQLGRGGALFMELGFDQTKLGEKLFIERGFKGVSTRVDYGGNPRVVSGYKT